MESESLNFLESSGSVIGQYRDCVVFTFIFEETEL
jgi:hypothetical protein